MSTPDSSPAGRRGSFLFPKRRKKSDSAGSEDERTPGSKKRPTSLMTRAERKKRKAKKGLGNSTEDFAEDELSGGGGASEESSSLPIPIPQRSEEYSSGSGGSGGGSTEFAKATRSSPSTKGFISGITKIAKRESREKKQKARARYKHRSSEDNKAVFDGPLEASRTRSSTHTAQGGTELDRALLLALRQDEEPEMPTTEEMRKAEELLNTLDSPRVVSRRDHSLKHTDDEEEEEEARPQVEDMYDIAFKLEPTTSVSPGVAQPIDSPSRHTLSAGYIDAKLAQGLLTEAEAQTLLMTTPRTLPVGVLDAVLRFEIKRDKQLIHAKLQGSDSPRSIGFSPRSPKDLISSDDFTDMWGSDGRLVSLDTLCDMSGLDDVEEDDDLLLSDPDSTEEELSRSASGHLSSCVSERDELDRDPIMDISEPSSYGDELARVESLAAAARESHKKAEEGETVTQLASEESAKGKKPLDDVSKEKRLRGLTPNEGSSYDMDTAARQVVTKTTGKRANSALALASAAELEASPSLAERKGKATEKGESGQGEKKGSGESVPKKQKKSRKEKKEKKERKDKRDKKEKKPRKERKEKSGQKAAKEAPPLDAGQGEGRKAKDPRAIFRAAGSGEGGLAAALLSSPSLLVSVPVHEVAPERAPDLELELGDSGGPQPLPLTRAPSDSVILPPVRQVAEARVQVERLGLQQRPAEPSESELELSMDEGLLCTGGVVAKRTESFSNMIEAEEGARSPTLSSPKAKHSRREGRVPLARRWEMMLKSNIEQADTRVQLQKLSREEKLKHEMEQERLRLEAVKSGLHYDPKEASPPTCSPKGTVARRSASASSPTATVVAGRIQMFESLSDAIDKALSAHRKLKSECSKCSLDEAQAEIAGNALSLLNEAAVHLQLLRDAAK